MKILIADDHVQNRYMLEQLLKASGHECVSVPNGREGLARAQAERFDLVISDILMPVMDGFQLCREMKTDPALRDIPFVFYTATYTGPADIEFGLQLGAARYLIKPAEPEVILEALQKIDPGPRAAPVPPPAQESDYLEQYNARLVQKLESKMLELERANTELMRTNLALGDEIGRRRAAERAASAASALQHATLESTADGVLAVSSTGEILAWNRSFAQLWGLPTEAVPAPSFEALLTRLCDLTLLPTECTLGWRNALSTDRPTDEPEVMTLVDGRILERLCRPLQLDDRPPGRVWTFRDVTARHRAEEHQRSLQAQLFELQKMEALGVLAGGVAHDFNNILTAILGQTSLALAQLDDRHPVRDSLEAVMHASQRATELVRQILAFSRRQEPKRVVMKVADAVSGALKLASQTLPAGVKLVAELTPDAPLVCVDPTQMHQVLMNLVTNANHAMKGHGTIRVTSRALTIPDGGHDEVPAGRYVVLSVTDSGPGIDERVRRRIFEPFFTTKPPGQGTGLGLSVVHGIISSYGGHVIARSEPGRGAEFLLYLPAAERDCADVSPALDEVLHRGAGEMILIAEDDPAVRDFVEVALTRLGYRPVSSPSAEDALARYDASPRDFAAVITDLSMPGMSGASLGSELRRRSPTLPVIIMTGYLSLDQFDEANPREDFELLLKPCTPQSLSQALRKVLRS